MIENVLDKKSMQSLKNRHTTITHLTTLAFVLLHPQLVIKHLLYLGLLTEPAKERIKKITHICKEWLSLATYKQLFLVWNCTEQQLWRGLMPKAGHYSQASNKLRWKCNACAKWIKDVTEWSQKTYLQNNFQQNTKS